MHRRTIILGLCSAAFLTAGAAPELGLKPEWLGLRVAGTDGVLVGVYFSLTCPHCGNWAKMMWPQIEHDLIATGKVRLQWLDCPLDEQAVRAHAAARLLPQEKHTAAVIGLLADQSWMTGGESALRAAMAPYGATDATFNGISGQLSSWLRNEEKKASVAGVPVTPTFTVRGKLAPGEKTSDDIASLVAKPA